jgi:light-regulated signal transduction histidine kinase (bacteriophytochrome)
VLVLLVALLVVGLQRGMMRPLAQLLDAARAIAAGKTGARLPPGKDAEFALVFSSFNQMAQSIEESLARLQETNRALVLSNQDLSRFAYVASHDLQTPLRSIASFVQLIEADYSHLMDEEGKSWLKRVLQSTHLLQMTIRDLLSYSRLESSPKPFEQVSLEDALASACMLLESSIKESEAVMDHDPLPVIMGDENQLVQLFQNLINNALKFRSDAPPRISITSQQMDGKIRIAVKDNGIGIPEQYQKKVFEIFQRLHSQSRYPGTGIGLTICQRIMQRHGGDIHVESDGVNGSTFMLDFPLPETGRPE